MRWFLVAAVLLVAIALGVGFFVHARQGRAQAPTSPQEARVVTMIPIEGMACLACTAKVKSTLKAINGVTEVEVNLAGHDARVEYVEGKVSPEELVSAINRLGYRAGSPRAQETK
jgi:copper chaperone CopZ